jgi:hypothetical protein
MHKSILCLLVISSSASAATYYVSPDGSNRNAGTSASRPLAVVQHAIDEMKSGDTLIVLDGLYAGTLKLKSGITLRAKNPRRVVFTGAEPVTAKFKKYKGNIYRAKMKAKPKQVFYRGQRMTWARWPNVDWRDNWVSDKKWAVAKEGTGPGLLTSDAFKEIDDLDLAGAYCFIRYGKGNSCYSRKIESYDGRTLRWNDNDFYEQKFTGEDGWRGAPGRDIPKDNHYHPLNSRYFLAGKLALLDAPGEWMIDCGYLYLYPPDGSDPNKAVVLAQSQDFVIRHESALADVTIEGVDFMATSMSLSNRNNANITVRNNHFSYTGGELLFIDRLQGNPSQKPILLCGEDILVERCLFIGAQLSALQLKGKNIAVVNNVFMENNRNAVFEARPLALWPKGHYRISRNSFINNCSDAVYIRWEFIDIPPKQPEMSYNLIANTGIFHSDVSGIYMPSRSQGYLELHHNWLTRVNGNAIRLDISGKHLVVHHNVIWNAKRGLNIEGHGDFLIYNNTSVLNDEADVLILNQVKASKSVPEGWAAEDYTFPPIGIAPNDNWYVHNNLVTGFLDKAKGREYRKLKVTPAHPDRKRMSINLVNRGSIKGNLMRFAENAICMNIRPGSVDLRPLRKAQARIRNGAVEPAGTAAPRKYTAALGQYKGAYDVGGTYWYPGSDWLPYGLQVPKTMASADALARKLATVSIEPRITAKNLKPGRLHEN